MGSTAPDSPSLRCTILTDHPRVSTGASETEFPVGLCSPGGSTAHSEAEFQRRLPRGCPGGSTCFPQQGSQGGLRESFPREQISRRPRPTGFRGFNAVLPRAFPKDCSRGLAGPGLSIPTGDTIVKPTTHAASGLYIPTGDVHQPSIFQDIASWSRGYSGCSPFTTTATGVPTDDDIQRSRQASKPRSSSFQRREASASGVLIPYPKRSLKPAPPNICARSSLAPQQRLYSVSAQPSTSIQTPPVSPIRPDPQDASSQFHYQEKRSSILHHYSLPDTAEEPFQPSTAELILLISVILIVLFLLLWLLKTAINFSISHMTGMDATEGWRRRRRKLVCEEDGLCSSSMRHGDGDGDVSSHGWLVKAGQDERELVNLIDIDAVPAEEKMRQESRGGGCGRARRTSAWQAEYGR